MIAKLHALFCVLADWKFLLGQELGFRAGADLRSVLFFSFEAVFRAMKKPSTVSKRPAVSTGISYLAERNFAEGENSAIQAGFCPALQLCSRQTLCRRCALGVAMDVSPGRLFANGSLRQNLCQVWVWDESA